MKISYVIVAYNTEQYIAACIKSILKQKHHEQIIVINDGSMDNTKEVIESFKEKEIIVINHESNKGCCFSRMEGMKLCTGDYMTFIDSDDYYLKQLPSPGLFGPDIIDFAMVGAFNNIEKPDKICSSGELSYSDEDIWDAYRKKKINQILVNKLIHKRVYKKVAENLNIDDLPNFCDNLAIMSCYAFYAKSYKLVDDICYYYRQGTGMTTYLPKIDMFRQLCEQKKVVDILEKLGMPRETLMKEIVSRTVEYYKWFEKIAEIQKLEDEKAIAEGREPVKINFKQSVDADDAEKAKKIMMENFADEIKEYNII